MALTFAFTGCSQGKDSVAKVNDKEISVEDFQNEFNLYRKMVYGQMPASQLKEDAGNGQEIGKTLGSQVTDTMVMDKVLRDEFDKEKLEITEEEKAEALQNLIDQSGGDEAFESQLESMGIEKAQMEAIVEKTLIQEKLRDNYIEKNQKTDEEIKDFFEKNKDSLVSYDVSHILVDTEEEASKIKEEIEAGKDFAELAKEYSKDGGSAENGGDLGEITMETNFVQPFLDAVKDMKAGDVSEPVESEFGFHIIKVNGLKDQFEDHKDQINEKLLEAELNTYFQELYDNADVTVYKSNINKAVEDQIDKEIKEEKETPEAGQEDENQVEEVEEPAEEEASEEVEESEEVTE